MTNNMGCQPEVRITFIVKKFMFKLLWCQPEPVEGGLIYSNGFDKLTLTISKNRTYVICKEHKKFMSASD